jgi:Hsp20/alpha crystallin family
MVSYLRFTHPDDQWVQETVVLSWYGDEILSNRSGVKWTRCGRNWIGYSTGHRAVAGSSERTSGNEETREGYYLRERVSGSMSSVVLLPADVKEDGAKASFKNGVLEVTLKKIIPLKKTRILIE